jgi:chromosomal replication initiator protein
MNIEAVWSEFLKMAREEAGSRTVDTWFRALSLKMWDAQTGIAYVHAPNTFVREWVAAHYTGLVEQLLARLFHATRARVIFFDGDAATATPAVAITEPRERGVVPANHVEFAVPGVAHGLSIVPAVRAPRRALKVRSEPETSTLCAEYQFANFVVGAHNSLAYSAANAIVERLGVLYNPFFIYGHSGLGKTHLLHAVGNAVRAQRPGSRVVYQSANRFVADFIQAIRCDRVYQFEAKYKNNLDVLLIDDVQFLAHKEQTQEAFFHLFNTLYHANKQIVCTSDSLPGDIAGLADRVRSRLVSGLVVDISEPQLETKIAIIKHKAAKQGESLTDDIAEYIARASGSSVRDMEGALIRVMAYASLRKELVTLSLVQDALAHATVRQEPEKSPDMVTIATVVERQLQFSLRTLRSQERNKGVAFARHVAMYLMKKQAHASLREICAFFHRRDHSTVLYAIEKIELLQRKDPECTRTIRLIEQQLSGR